MQYKIPLLASLIFCISAEPTQRNFVQDAKYECLSVISHIRNAIGIAASDIIALEKEASTIIHELETLVADYPASVTARLACEKPDRYSSLPAQVIPSPFPEEESILKKRRSKSLQALSHLLETDLTPEQLPVIGFCGSGGGIRAQFGTLGWLCAAQKNNLLDALQYVAGLSGSTWALNPWIASKMSPTSYKEHIVPRLTQSLKEQIRSLSTTDRADLLIMLGRRYYAQQSLSPVDLYAGLLAHIFFKDLPNVEHPFEITYSSLRPQIESGDYPFVLSASIIANNKCLEKAYSYNPTFEFSPLTSGCFELDTFVPIWSLGRPFSEGSSQTITPRSLFPEVAYLKEGAEYVAPAYTKIIEAMQHLISYLNTHDYYGHELPLPYLMGICGSAFAADMKNILIELYNHLYPGPIPDDKQDLLEVIIKVIQKALDKELGKLVSTLSAGRLSPQESSDYLAHHEFAAASLANPSFHNTGALASEQSLTLIDAGLSLIGLERCNIGIIPLLERGVDCIFVCDSSSALKGAPSLRAAQKIAAKRDLPFPQIDFDALDEKDVSLIIDNNNPRAPIIVYLPVRENEDYNKLIGRRCDPRADVYDTFNFQYTPEQANDLMGLVEYLVAQNQPTIITALKKAVERKAL